MKKEKVVFDFIKLTATEKPEFGTNVIQKMTGNPRFPNPDESLDSLRIKNELVQSRSVAALSGGKEATALLHQAIDDWDNAMRKEAKYVDRIADGDGAIILSAGFNLAKPNIPGQRAEFTAENGEHSGTAALRHIAIDGAKSYIWQYCIGETPANENGWTIGTVTTKASAEITGLIPLTKYWFRVAAVTVDGTSAYSQPILLVVI
jgi:hypothetical protein